MAQKDNPAKHLERNIDTIIRNGIHIRGDRHAIELESQTRASQAILEKHTKIFASMCPDEILDYYDNYDTREYYTTLMLGDVSGFTDLTEKYTKTGKGGPSKLTETLNSYIGAMVQEILSHNGDVLKFSGDAFIVMWKLQEGMVMRDLAIEAMQTACVIQKHFGTYDTDVGVTLKVKLAIAAGKIYFTSIGDPDTMSYYIITGRPVWDVKFAEGLCRGGDILVAPSCWQWANPTEYVYQTLPDGIHTLIIACSSTWYQSRDDVYDSSEENEDGETATHSVSTASVSSPRTIPDTEAEAVLMDLTGESNHENTLKHVDYSLRPKIIKVAKAHLKDSLRSYLLRPVVRSVEMDEPLEYLTEMRQVVILFINVITSDIGKKTLISLVNSAYILVCGIVGEMQGCVNKTSLFDKDLMFLCIFGLRGDKHELESQIGLKCASKVRENLVAMKNVKSVTVGVTTGMTYCGVVGHILRREYTVIGMSVNKAARLMVAYSDKVVCDRESFLHSHLEARHFILQEPKHLKGITNVGPVYEFHEQPKYAVPDLVWNKYPLLGRNNEIRTFQEMLATLAKYSTSDKSKRRPKPKYNTLIIKGEPRIGKTRLLDEITQNVPTGVPCNYVSLVMDDVKAPYNLVHLIFSLPLGFTVTTTRKERENKLISRLGVISHPHFLCALNQPFNVRFALSHRYKALSELEKRRVLQRLLLNLMKGCFEELWVIVIDDGEYGDEESLQLFDTMTKRYTVLFVISIGRKLSAEYRLFPALLNKAKVIELTGIDKWYHAGLACQILNVNGIPAELEKLIQERSSGNPGWIESYLVSLVQAGGIMMLNVSRKEAEMMGYVLPHVTMLKRFVSHTTLGDVGIMEERADRWQMYRTSFPDSVSSLIEEKGKTFRKTAAYSESDDTTVTICKILENFMITDIEAEGTMDVMILKLFDSLTPLDQLLLKCASVLGQIVNRHMLENLMDATSEREIGLEELEDLPRYASCGLMRFKMALFRDTTYRLLTENQKMELHSKALKYLQQYTRRCLACGEGQFGILLGRTVTQDSKRKTIELNDILDNDEYEDESPPDNVDKGKSKKFLSCLNIFRGVKRKPTSTFSSMDFTNCQCHLILMTVYAQIMDHCHGIGKKEMTLTAILEFVQICLINYNVPQARKLLTECEQLIQQMFQSNDDELVVLPYLTGKIRTLQGRCYLESGLLMEAEDMFHEALNNLGYKFPSMEFVIDFKSMIQLEQLRLRLVCSKNKQPPKLEENHIDYTEQLADCLAQMFDLFRTKGMKKHARLAALWGLNAALKSGKNFFILCATLTNMLITAHIYQNRNIMSYLEHKGINICNESGDDFEFQNLKTIAELYAGVFFSRWTRGQIVKAIKIGFICLRMSNSIGCTFLKLLILPRLAHLLMISCRHSEVVIQLRELEFVSTFDLEKSGRTWYFALCADVKLDTGLTILSFRNCEQYFLQEGEMIISLRDPEAQRRYFTSMWLWCIRSEQWEASELWSNKNIDSEILMDEHTVAATITTLKKLEGLLLLYVHKVNSRNITAVVTMSEIKNTFKSIVSSINVVKIAIPRYTLLKAYYSMIKSRKGTAMKLLRRTKNLCLKMKNRMIYNWAEHCQKAWSGSISSVHEDMWKDVTKRESQKEWEEINTNDSKMVPFTFPLPKYTS